MKRLAVGFSLCVALGVVPLAPGTAHSCTINWTGAAGDGQWLTPNNWSTSMLPNQSDDVCIASGNNVALGGSSSIGSLTNSGNLTITRGPGRSLSLATTSEVASSGSLTHESGTLTVAQMLTIIGQFNLGDAQIDGEGRTLLQGMTTITGGANLYGHRLDNNGTVTMTGLGGLALSNDSVFTNNGGGTFDVQNDGRVYFSSGSPPGRFQNDGTFRRTTSTGIATIEVLFASPGTLSVQTGALWMFGNGTYTGPISVAANAMWDLRDRLHFLGSTPIAGPGTVAVSGATVQVASGVTAQIDAAFRFTGGIITGGGQLELNGACEWLGGTMTTPDDTAPATTIVTRTMTLRNGSLQRRNLVNRGVVTMGPGFPLLGMTSAVLTNENQFEIQDDAEISGGALSRVVNQGRFIKGGDTGRATRATISVDFENNMNAEVHVQAGTLLLTGDGRHRGLANVEAGFTLELGNRLHTVLAEGRRFTGPGTLVLSSGSLVFASDATIDTDFFTLSGGELRGFGQITIAGKLTWTAGIMSGVDGTQVTNANGGMDLVGLSKLLDNRTLNNNSTTVPSTMSGMSSSLGLRNRALLVNSAGATFDIQNDERISSGPIEPDWGVINKGIFRRSTSSGVARVEVPFTHFPADRMRDKVYVDTGTLVLSGGSVRATNNQSGMFEIGYGAALQFDGGTHFFNAFDATFGGQGTVLLSNGGLFLQGSTHLTFSESLTSFTLSDGGLTGFGVYHMRGRFIWTGGRMFGPGQTVIESTSRAELSGRGKVLSERHLINYGTVRMLDGGGLSLELEATLSNQMIFQLWNQMDQEISAGYEGGLFQNRGKLTSFGSGATTIGVEFENSLDGSVTLLRGTLRLSGGSGPEPATDRGRFDVREGARLNFAGGTHRIGTVGAFARGDGTVELSGGTLSVDYPVELRMDAPFAFSGGILTGSGDIQLNRRFTWTGGTMSGSGTTRVSNTMEVTRGVTLDRRTLQNFGQSSTSALAGAIVCTNNARVLNGDSGRSPGDGAGAIFDIQNDQGIFVGSDGGGSQVINYGTLLRSTSSGVAAVQVHFVNFGMVAARSGTLQFTNTADSSGTIGIAGGAFAFNLGLNNTGVVSGDGRLTGNVTNGGMLRPGSAKSTGILDITGNLTQAKGGAVNIKIGGRTPGSQYDQINLTGSANLSGILNISLLGGFRPFAGDTFRILSYASRSGTFSTISGLDLGKGLSFQPEISDTGFTLTVVGGAKAKEGNEEAVAEKPAEKNEKGNPETSETMASGLIKRGRNRRGAPRFAYVSNATSEDISGYAVDRATGALTAMESSPFDTGVALSEMIVEPSGRFLYGTNTVVKGKVNGFAIDAKSGTLTPIDGSPFAAGKSPRSLATDPSGHFLYVGNSGSRDISAYAIDSKTGGLTSVTASSFAAGDSSAIAIDPAGRFLYATSSVSDNVYAFTIESATGGLTPVPGSPFAAGARPLSVVAEPSGQFVYVLNGKSETISAYAIDAMTGVLAEIDGSPYAAGDGPLSMVAEPFGQFLYIAASLSNHVAAFRFDEKTGGLVPLPNFTLAAGGEPRSLHVDSTGQFVYAVNPRSDNVLGFALDPATGALVPMAGAPFAAGTGPSSIISTNGPCLVCPEN